MKTKKHDKPRSPLILAIDGANFIHRAQSGFMLGDYSIVFNFFRNLRALIEMHTPSRVYFCLEGRPHKRFALYPDYKANRKIEGDVSDPSVVKKMNDRENYFRQSQLIIDLLTSHFPVSVVQHSDYECDDVIYNLIKKSSTIVPWTVVSNDSDFTQLLNEFSHVKLYNPISKMYVETPLIDYVKWKSLRGDGSDNIPGIPGVGDKTADHLVRDVEQLNLFLNNQTIVEHFNRNYDLIKFHSWSDDEDAMKMTCSTPTNDWKMVAKKFDEWSFKSLLKETTWTKFCDTFEPLWGQNEY